VPVRVGEWFSPRLARILTINSGQGPSFNSQATITIGAFNNKKTYQNETTEILIDDVGIRGWPMTKPPKPPGPKTLLSANFDQRLDGFSFAKDLFRGTRHPAYAQGTHLPTGGYSKGGL